MSQPAPNYYAVIPATVRYCKDLPPAARLLYGELTALSTKEGYCWASNKYFETLYDVSDRTIRNWLDSLQERGLIRIEIVRAGFQVSRRIWITESAQKIISTGKKIPDDRKKFSGGAENKFRQNTYSSTPKKNDDVPLDAVNPKSFKKEVIVASSSFSTSFDEKQSLRNDVGKTLNDEQFEKGYECYCEARGKQGIRNPAAWITAAALKKFSTDIRVDALSQFLEISYPGHSKSHCFFYENCTFTKWWEEVKAILGRYGLLEVA